MPESTPSRRRDRREARRIQRRSRVRTAALVLVALLVVVGAVVAATGVVSLGGEDAKRAAGSVSVAPADLPTTSNAPAKHACRAMSSDDPLRVWVGGDSLAGSLGPALGEIVGTTGVVQPYFDSRVSSGLSNPGFFDWPDHAKSEVARLDPEIVVFIIGTNDYSTPTSDDTWKADYAKRVEEMLSVLGGDGRTVYWVGAPSLKDDRMDAGAVAVSEAAAGVVAKHADAEYVDAHKLFTDSDGKYAQNLTDATGKLVTMRAGDGVHLTVAGGEYLARAVYAQLDAQCRITAQKVEGHDKQTIQTEGSTKVAPGSKSDGATVQTTPPYSAPPTTTLPAITAPPTIPPTTTVPTTTVPTTIPPTTTPPSTLAP